jgi:hypothetical protein
VIQSIPSSSLYSNKFSSGDRVVVVSPNTELVKKARRFQRKLQEAVPDIDVGYAAFLDDDINNMTIPLSRHKRLEKANSRKLQPQSKDLSSQSISTDLEEEGEPLPAFSFAFLLRGHRYIIHSSANPYPDLASTLCSMLHTQLA